MSVMVLAGRLPGWSPPAHGAYGEKGFGMDERTMAAVVLTDDGHQWWSATMASLISWLRMRSYSDSAAELVALYGLDGAAEAVKLDYRVSQGEYDENAWAMAEVEVIWPDGHVQMRQWAVDGRA